MKTPNDISASQRGFTLLELLVVAVALIIFITLLVVITE
jgi:prepilin-type N-terminal cleavage/methylation domain-containing protein